MVAECHTTNDIRTLSRLLRSECLPIRKGIGNEDQVLETNRRIFPILVPPQLVSPLQVSLTTLVHSAARTWLEILPLCPDALLDLSYSVQQALIELLCWSVGSKDTVINLIERNRLNSENDVAVRLLIRKIAEFDSQYPLAQGPQDVVLLSWLKIRPPDLKQTFLILPVEVIQKSELLRWFEMIDSLIPTLYLNDIIIKVLAPNLQSISLSIRRIELSWSGELEGQLNRSLRGQFDAAMDPKEKLMGKALRFHELFGPGITEEETTGMLISASNQSLSRMLGLGNRLFQKHCEQVKPEMYLYLDELDDILKSA
jgi:hypothetical protein